MVSFQIQKEKKGEWIVGLGFTYNIGEQATIS